MRKKALNSGKATIDKNGRFVHSRETGPDCGCKLECFIKVDEEDRKRILDTFNRFGDYNLQIVYLKGLMDREEIKRVGAQGMNRNAEGEKQQQRKCSYEYSVHTKESEGNHVHDK